jgi:hypothetical protein
MARVIYRFSGGARVPAPHPMPASNEHITGDRDSPGGVQR